MTHTKLQYIKHTDQCGAIPVLFGDTKNIVLLLNIYPKCMFWNEFHTSCTNFFKNPKFQLFFYLISRIRRERLLIFLKFQFELITLKWKGRNKALKVNSDNLIKPASDCNIMHLTKYRSVGSITISEKLDTKIDIHIFSISVFKEGKEKYNSLYHFDLFDDWNIVL